MLNFWLFPLLDYAVYPLFELPASVSLTVVSGLTGGLMIWLYWLTSDQWWMAYEKRRIKEAQTELLRGESTGKTWIDLLLGNFNLFRAALVPAVVTVLLLVLLVPWVGSRFGYWPHASKEAISVSVTSEANWSASTEDDLRLARLGSDNHTRVGHLRIMGLSNGVHNLILQPVNDDPVTVPVRVGVNNPPIWPDVPRTKWYHRFVMPAGVILHPDSPIRKVHLGYEPVFQGFGFWFLGTYLPGWLTYYFVVSFLVGVYFKLRYSIE